MRGREADMAASLSHVRFAPESGHCSAPLACPLCAKSGHTHRNIECPIRSPRQRWTARQLSRLLRLCVSEVGPDLKKYGIESLRRTKAFHILNGSSDLQVVRVLLGHSKLESTARYQVRIRLRRRAQRICETSCRNSRYDLLRGCQRAYVSGVLDSRSQIHGPGRPDGRRRTWSEASEHRPMHP